LFAKGGKRGDLVVTLRVQLPDPFDPELEAAIRAWREKKEGNGL
jgi:hypothetical protein